MTARTFPKDSLAQLANESYAAGFMAGLSDGLSAARQIINGKDSNEVLSALKRKCEEIESGMSLATALLQEVSNEQPG